METLAQDLRYGLRTLRNSRGFAATAVLSIALGIGANTAIFSLIDSVMLRWLPVRDPQDLFVLTSSGDGLESEAWSDGSFRALSDHAKVFSTIGAYGTAMRFAVGPFEAIERVPGSVVSGSFHDTLGVAPVLGRLLNRSDDEPGAPPVVVITHGYWTRSFGRAPDVVGRSIRIEGTPVTVIGVTPPGFVGAVVGEAADLTLTVSGIRHVAPDIARSLLSNNPAWMRIVGRLRTGLGPDEAEKLLRAEWPNIVRALIPTPSRGQERMLARTLKLRPGGTGTTTLRQQFGRPLWALMVFVSLILLIACANVANLVLFRAVSREGEFALRLAIGAGRGRLIRQLLTECAVLSLFGSALGVAIAWFGGRAVVQMLAFGYPNGLLVDLQPDARVLGYTIAIASVVTILVGIFPAFRATKAGRLNDGASRVTASRSRFASLLVMAQVGLSVVLLIAAGLFVRTWHNLDDLDPGFRHEGILLMDVDGGRAGYKGPNNTQLYIDLQERFERLPGVTSASFSWWTPLSGQYGSVDVRFSDRAPQPGETARPNFVSTRFFETMQTPVISGRELGAPDLQVGAPRVVVVNESFVKRYLPNGRALGERFSYGLPQDVEIVGVVRDAVVESLRQDPPPTIYIPYAPARPVTFEVRVSGSLAQASLRMRKELQRSLPGVFVEVRTLTEQVQRTLVQERLMAILASAFGVLAVVLAAVGLSGLLAYGVVSRTKEIGIRMMLGANSRELLRTVIMRAISLGVIGAVVGIAISAALARWIESMLFRLEATDAATFAGAAIVLLIVAVVAAYIPARRAASIVPVEALRQN